MDADQTGCEMIFNAKTYAIFQIQVELFYKKQILFFPSLSLCFARHRQKTIWMFFFVKNNLTKKL